jgi:hypothetical protein
MRCTTTTSLKDENVRWTNDWAEIFSLRPSWYSTCLGAFRKICNLTSFTLSTERISHRLTRDLLLLHVWLLRFRWSRGSVLAFGTPSSRFQTRPEAFEFFREKKNNPSEGKQIRPVPCRRFSARKISLKWRGSRYFRLNYRSFSPNIYTFHC